MRERSRRRLLGSQEGPQESQKGGHVCKNRQLLNKRDTKKGEQKTIKQGKRRKVFCSFFFRTETTHQHSTTHRLMTLHLINTNTRGIF